MAVVPYSSDVSCTHKNSPSTVVHGCTTVEDGSNGLTAPIILRFLSTLPDAFIRLQQKFNEVKEFCGDKNLLLDKIKH